jgi:hypothetical protein
MVAAKAARLGGQSPAARRETPRKTSAADRFVIIIQ